jgi:uncharacterized protein (DUF1810 family)
MDDPYRLSRFVTAQNDDDTYASVVAELRAGHKVTHWMWFIFPQIVGLGHSATAREYAISNVAEARAYLDHPVLGARLLECTQLLLATNDRTATQILGATDAMKLRSSMTLFHAADPTNSVYQQVLDKYFQSQPDEATATRLNQQ